MVAPAIILLAFVACAGAQTTTLPFTPLAANVDFPSPERGFYGWSGSDFVTAYDAGSVAANFNAGRRLSLALVDLSAYRTTSLPSTFLSQLAASFGKIRTAGMKTTLVFAYDSFTGSGVDATAAQITAHLQQLKPTLAAAADVIPYMRAGFIGAYGEWHDSTSGNSCNANTVCNVAAVNANRAAVRDALLANVPTTTQIGFRLPADLMLWYPNPATQPRAGFNNDCFLAPFGDAGTYDYGAPGDVQRAYMQNRTKLSAFGGETCTADGMRSQCSDILTEGAQYHLAWLNHDFSPVQISNWTAQGCIDQVAASMGYRLELNSITAPTSIAQGASSTVTVTLRNVGWARMFSNRKLVVTLQAAGSSKVYTIGKGGTLNTLPAQSTALTTVKVTVNVASTVPVGTYALSLSAPDAFAALAKKPVYSARFANADNAAAGQSWSASAGAFVTGVSVNVFAAAGRR